MNCLFYVQPKNLTEKEIVVKKRLIRRHIGNFPVKYAVYDVKCDKNGYPLFLIYKDNQWIYKSAKNFVPV